MLSCILTKQGVCKFCGLHPTAQCPALIPKQGPQQSALSDRVNTPPDLTRTDAPSFLTKIKNFASAAVGHVAAGMPMATDEEIIRRHDICLGCEHLKNNACELCGCPISREFGYVSKLSWADQKCPAGKW